MRISDWSSDVCSSDLMHMDHLRDSAGDVTSVAAAQTRSEAMAACHGTATPPVADDHSHTRPAELVDAKSPLGDCCQAGDCCECMHPFFAAHVGSTIGIVSFLYRQMHAHFRHLHATQKGEPPGGK